MVKTKGETLNRIDEAKLAFDPLVAVVRLKF